LRRTTVVNMATKFGAHISTWVETIGFGGSRISFIATCVVHTTMWLRKRLFGYTFSYSLCGRKLYSPQGLQIFRISELLVVVIAGSSETNLASSFWRDVPMAPCPICLVRLFELKCLCNELNNGDARRKQTGSKSSKSRVATAGSLAR
jgi:hypothetical protein